MQACAEQITCLLAKSITSEYSRNTLVEQPAERPEPFFWIYLKGSQNRRFFICMDDIRRTLDV